MASQAEGLKGADVIVVGAGHNGLVAACYLARAGVNVLVVEAHSKVGGMTVTSPMEPEAPGHLINEGAIQASSFPGTTIDADLELTAKYGLQLRLLDPYHVHLSPEGESLAFWKDPQKTAEEIKYYSPKDAKAWLELCELMHAALEIGLPMMQTSPVRPELGRLLTTIGRGVRHVGKLRKIIDWALPSAAEVLERTFEHSMVRAPVCSLLPFGSFKQDFGGWGLIYFTMIHRSGAGVFMGGTSNLPDSLQRCLLAHGGRVRTSAPVEELIVQGGRVTGVRLQGGEELVARKAVVTTMNPKRALTGLLPQGTLSPALAKRAEHIPTLNRGNTDYLLNIACKGKLTLSRHQKWRDSHFKGGADLRLPCITWNTYQEALDAWDACNRGDVPEKLAGLAHLNTAVDPSLAPEGHETLWFWAGLTPSRPREGWDKARATITERAIKELAQFYDGIEELEIGRRAIVMPDIAKRFWALDGNVFHGDVLLSRSGPLKPALGLAGYKTPVPGLFISGGGTHPVAGIAGLPGQITARVVLRNLR
ncbi:MAG: NAD(P)/FAD-dependent oxidoreductase [Deltaproteobacteria bacterium]|nr:NAD(P)/FAD-dependent oxidoreductase [Deltaproteobacteria bacterium]